MFQNICKVRGWKKGDPQYEKTKTVLNNVWIGLQAKADADNDQQINTETAHRGKLNVKVFIEMKRPWLIGKLSVVKKFPSKELAKSFKIDFCPAFSQLRDVTLSYCQWRTRAVMVAAWMSDRLAILSLQAACPATVSGSEVISKLLVRSDVPPPRRSPVVVQYPGLNRAGRPSTIICVNVNASALHKSRQTRLSVDQLAPVNEQIAANLTRWEREFPTEQFLASGMYPSPELQTFRWTEGKLGYFHPRVSKSGRSWTNNLLRHLAFVSFPDLLWKDVMCIVLSNKPTNVQFASGSVQEKGATFIFIIVRQAPAMHESYVTRHWLCVEDKIDYRATYSHRIARRLLVAEGFEAKSNRTVSACEYRHTPINFNRIAHRSPNKVSGTLEIDPVLAINAVTNEEWCKMWEEYSRNPNSVLDWQLQFRDFMFDLEDTSGDGAIDEEEFAMICSSYNVPEQNARDAFRKFSRNGTLEITREKFGELWVEYFASEDPSAPGNFIFGVTKFE
ncbi:Non-specific lipid-transfer protein [Homalodisca vitripennis]|nr:Non-specific lipid-transfer protein [Homalodisca vitripennis]